MKLFKISRASIATTLSIVLCTSVISSCGSSKDSKKSDTPTIGSATGAPTKDGVPATTQTLPAPANSQNLPLDPNAAPAVLNSGEQAAPVGKTPTISQSGTANSSTSAAKKDPTVSVPDFKDPKAILTGGKSADLNYTSASDDGLMDMFRTNSAGVPAAQQSLNKAVANAITAARLVKSGADMILDLALIEGGSAKTMRLRAVTDGSKMKLTEISNTAVSQFQGGFLKCLEASCEQSYAKIKIEGGYARIIFRNTNMNNNFRIQEKITDVDFTKWTSYIYNTIQGSGGNATIASVRASSYEILNGKSAMGIQMLTNDNEAFTVATPLLAPSVGTELKQVASKYADPSASYNLPSTAGKTFVLSKSVQAVTLVNNNGKGAIKLQLTIGSGSIWMVLSPVPKITMTAAEVKAFEATFPQAF